MAKLSLLLLFVVTVVTLRQVVGECDEDDCPSPSGPFSSDYCSSRRKYLQCLRDTIIHNMNCDKSTRDTTETVADGVEAVMDTFGCDGAAGLAGSLLVCLGLTGIAYIFGSFK